MPTTSPKSILLVVAIFAFGLWFTLRDDVRLEPQQSTTTSPHVHHLADLIRPLHADSVASAGVLPLEGTIDAGAREMRSIPTCSDKFTSHRYQEMYSRMLLPYRQKDIHRDSTTKDTASTKLLEIGLGCQFHGCAAGGAHLYRRYMPPSTTYHSLEFNIRACKDKYDRSNVKEALARYIDDHLCSGSSADDNVLSNCGRKFGPFDIVIDDGSHMHAHTTYAFRYWLNSSNLKPGGVLVIEDLQVSSWVDFHNTASDAAGPHPPELYHPAIRGTTTMSYGQRLFLCKLAGVLCHAPPAGPLHASLPYLAMVDEVVIGPEIVGFRKTRAPAAAVAPGVMESVVLNDDVAIVLSQPHFPHLGGSSSLVFASKAQIVIVWATSWVTTKTSGECSALSSNSTVEEMNRLFAARFGTRGFDVWQVCLAAQCDARCTVAKLQNRAADSSSFDLIWVVVPAKTQDATTFQAQQAIVGLLSSVALGDLLRPGGVVAVDGLQERQRRSVASAPNLVDDELRNPKDLSEPLLQFVADLSMQMILLSPEPRFAKRKRASKKRSPPPDFPWVASPSATRALWYVGDMSISAYGAMYLRKVDPMNRRRF